jgi:hypothetical protein
MNKDGDIAGENLNHSAGQDNSRGSARGGGLFESAPLPSVIRRPSAGPGDDDRVMLGQNDIRWLAGIHRATPPQAASASRPADQLLYG